MTREISLIVYEIRMPVRNPKILFLVALPIWIWMQFAPVV